MCTTHAKKKKKKIYLYYTHKTLDFPHQLCEVYFDFVSICKAALHIIGEHALMPQQLKSVRWEPSGFYALTLVKETVSRQ